MTDEHKVRRPGTNRNQKRSKAPFAEGLLSASKSFTHHFTYVSQGPRKEIRSSLGFNALPKLTQLVERIGTF
jgi:hypothetical protein